MKRSWYGWVAAITVAASATACDIGTGIKDFPTSGRVRVEGTAPEELKLIVSTVFIEQINLETNERSVLILESDTVSLTLPFDQTYDLSETGSLYAELLYAPTSTASITLRVNLNNGEDYQQVATLSSGAQLIYYWVWTGPIPR